MAKGDGVEPIQPQVKADAAVGNVPYSATLNKVALENNALSEIGMQVAQAAANKNAENLGAEAGKNPNGDLPLPVLTEADKHYHDAYLSQSQNVMGLRLSELQSKANLEIANVYKLTPEIIDKYNQTLVDGGQEILKSAPEQIKNHLSVIYANNLLGNTEKLKTKLIDQQHDETRQVADLANTASVTTISNLGMQLNVGAAQLAYESHIANNKRLGSTGVWSPSKVQISDDSAKMAFYGSIFSGHLLEARKEGGEAVGKYLSRFEDIKNKPSDLTDSQWFSVGDSVLKLEQHQNSLVNTQQQVAISDFKKDIVLGNPQKDKLLSLRDILSPVQFNDLEADFVTSELKKSNTIKKNQEAIDAYQNTRKYSSLTTEQVNHAWRNQVDGLNKLNNSQGLTNETSAALSAGGVVPEYVETIRNMAWSDNPMDLDESYRAFQTMRDKRPQNIRTLGKETEDMFKVYGANLQFHRDRPDNAYLETRKTMVEPIGIEKEAIQLNVNEYLKKNYSDPNAKKSLALKLLNPNQPMFGSKSRTSIPIQDEAIATQTIFNRFQTNLELFKNDPAKAMIATQQDVDRTAGDTYVNGIRQRTLFSAEKVLAIEPEHGGTFALQQDVAEQLALQFKEIDASYDKHWLDERYEIVDVGKFSPERYKESLVTAGIESRKAQTYQNSIAIIDEKMKSLPHTHLGPYKSSEKEWNELQAQKTALEKQFGGSKVEGFIDTIKSKITNAARNKINKLQDELPESDRSYMQDVYPASVARNIQSLHQPIQVKKIRRGLDGKEHSEILNLVVSPLGDALSLQYGDRTTGPFELTLRSETGAPQDIPDIHGNAGTKLRYYANNKVITDNANKFANLYQENSKEQILDDAIGILGAKK